MIGTAIEWASDTVNFWWGCSKVSPACEHCYAEALDARFNGGHWGKDAPRRPKLESALADLKKIRNRATGGFYRCQACGWKGNKPKVIFHCPICMQDVGHKVFERPRVFVNSMSDFFEDRRDLDEPRLRALDAMRLAPEVDFLLLTKRPHLIRHFLGCACRDAMDAGQDDVARWIEAWWDGKAPHNIWLGTTCENQEWADKRIHELLKVPAAVRFLSCEPLLGPVDLDGIQLQAVCEQGCGKPVTMSAFYATAICGCCTEGPEHLATGHIDWVICGGESGAHARPMHPDWARSLRDQCAEARVPFHFKQWGEFAPRNGIGDDPHPNGTSAFALPDGRMTDLGWDGGSGPHLIGAQGMLRVGKKAAGRLLDGVEHNGFPEVCP